LVVNLVVHNWRFNHSVPRAARYRSRRWK